jgi:hypothetical protein
LSALDLAESAAGTIKNRESQQDNDNPKNGTDYGKDRKVQSEKQSQDSEYKSAVAFSHRAVIAARGSNLRAKDASHLAHGGEQDNRYDRNAIKWQKER